jgi:hypothetical protein
MDKIDDLLMGVALQTQPSRLDSDIRIILNYRNGTACNSRANLHYSSNLLNIHFRNPAEVELYGEIAVAAR